MPLKPGKMNGAAYTGPIRTKRQGASNIFPAGSGRQATLTLTAQAAGTSATYTITDPDALVNDIVIVAPVGATPAQAGVTSMVAQVLTEGTITVRVNNGSASALTAGALAVGYYICR